MKSVATIILNRNLPDATNHLYEHLLQYDGGLTDIFVVEAGSDSNRLSSYVTWYANWSDAIKNGLRFSRGMNFGLSQLWREGKFEKYDAFFLLTNDTILPPAPTVLPLLNVLSEHKRLGILSPCGQRWGERLLLKRDFTKYFWFIHNNAFLLRREFIESIFNLDQVNFEGFLFDGSNFRGYGSESELIAKAYANDWAAAITTKVLIDENESYLLNQSDLIKTEKYEENLNLYIEEGRSWMRKKYGFNSHWSMQQYVKSFYDKFFEFHPEYQQYKI